MRRRSMLLLMLLAVLASTTGCRKEADGTAPSVRILAPSAGYSVQVPSQITVTVAIQDEQKLTSVVLTLADGNDIPIAPSVQRDLSGRSQTVDLDLLISDEQIISGTYQLIARASDGTNDGRAFSSLTVLAASLRTEAVLIAPRRGVGPATIMQLDGDGNIGPWSTIPDMGELVTQGPAVFSAGAVLGPLQRRDRSATTWTTLAPNGTPPGSGIPFFHGLLVDPADGRIYVGQEDGFIRGYSSGGVSLFNGTSLPGHSSRTIAVLDDRLMSAAYRTSDGQWSLVGHSLIGGAVLNDLTLDLAPVRLVALGNDRVLVFGQRGNNVLIRSLHVLIGGPIDHGEIVNGQLRAVVTNPANEHFLALSNGIMRYRHATFSLDPIRTDIDAHALAWDPVNGALYAASGNELLRLDPGTWATTATWTLPFAIGEVEIVLNR